MWMSRKPLTPYFYPRPLRGGRRGVLSFDGTKSEFLSTPSARRATPVRRGAWSRRGYFYPRPLRGGRPRYLVPPRASFSNFYPRPLRGGRLGVHAVSMFSPIFLSTPSARRATITCCSRSSRECISIHALCEEGDPGLWHSDTKAGRISIHALCEEGDFLVKLCITVDAAFLSTPSARRATDPRVLLQRARTISIHALCEEGDPGLWHSDTKAGRISIHALCEEGDFLVKLCITVDAAFLSTPSARRATHGLQAGDVKVEISIHALCEEGDPPKAGLQAPHGDFYPRPLRGGRPLQMGTKADSLKISIHALCEEGDLTALFASLTGLISIHALCEEGDRQKP